MIAECLRDYIGLPGCSNEEPESGLNITDQPGFSLLLLDKIADTEKQTYKAVWEAAQTRAINRMSSDIISAFSKRFHLKRLTESVKLPEDIDTTDNQTVPSVQLRGFEIELALLDDNDYGISGLQVIHLQEIKFYSKVIINDVTFKIIDEDTFEVLETKVADLVVGWNTIWTNLNLLSYHVFIGYDATNISSVYLELPDNQDCGCSCICFCEDCGGRIRGAVYDESTNALTEGTNTFGLAGTIGVHCSYETILCNNKALFKNAFFHLLASELLKESLYTQRINKITTVDREIVKNEMFPDFVNQYQVELQQVVDGIDLNPADCCLVCEAQAQYVETNV